MCKADTSIPPSCASAAPHACDIWCRLCVEMYVHTCGGLRPATHQMHTSHSHSTRAQGSKPLLDCLMHSMMSMLSSGQSCHHSSLPRHHGMYWRPWSKLEPCCCCCCHAVLWMVYQVLRMCRRATPSSTRRLMTDGSSQSTTHLLCLRSEVGTTRP